MANLILVYDAAKAKLPSETNKSTTSTWNDYAIKCYVARYKQDIAERISTDRQR